MSDADSNLLEGLRVRANARVSPFIPRDRKPGFFERRKARKGIARREELLLIILDRWRSLWTLGMSPGALGHEDAALLLFRRAHALSPMQTDVGRVYAAQCMRVGLADEAVGVCRDLHARIPDDVSFRSTLALALLIPGAADEASEVGRAALGCAPSDRITQQLVSLLIAVEIATSVAADELIKGRLGVRSG